MSFTVVLYNLFKAPNSLRLPTDDDLPLSVQATLKAPTSIITPTMQINFGSTSINPTGYKYAYWQEMSRYYFVTDYINEGPIWDFVMTEDVCGTFRQAILDSTQYVLRSTSSYDGSIIDQNYPMTAQPTTEVSKSTQIYFPSSGSYVIGVVNGSGTEDGKIGCTSYYVVDALGMQGITQGLLNISNYSIADVSSNLAKAIVDPLQYITSCRYYPVTISTDTPNSYINIGFWTVENVSCIPLYVLNKTVQFDISVPKNPNADARGIWLNNSPYSTYELTIYPFGTFVLDSNLLMGVSAIRCTILLDIPTGVASLTVFSADTLNRIILRTDAQLGVDLPLSQITQNYMGATISLVQGASGVIQNFAHWGNGGGGIISEGIADIANTTSIMAGTIGDVVNCLTPKVQTKGAMGLLAGYSFSENCYGRLQSTFLIPADADNAHFGSPLCRSVQLSTLSGYCVCQNPKVDFAYSLRECQAIEAYLSSGVYIE